MKRRTFLKIAGMGSLSIASGCVFESEKDFFSLVQETRDELTGTASWYASTCRECPAGCGIIVKNREGRIIKVEGNPFHPINRGKLCMRGQAALQGVYNPDRLVTPLLREDDGLKPISFSSAEKILKDKMVRSKAGHCSIRMITEVVGENLLNLFKEILKRHGCPDPLIFEPFAYEYLKKANQTVFGKQGLASFNLEQADFLLSFGADFLETWLSPVEYARKFKTMHKIKNGKKGLFFHVGPYQSLTGANADRWLACEPGSETAIALWLIKVMGESGRKNPLSGKLHKRILETASCYPLENTGKLSGVPEQLMSELALSMLNARKPLILGTGSGATGPNALETNVVANYLNLALDPDLSMIDFKKRHRVEIADSTSEILQSFKALERDKTALLLLNNVNPVYSLPPDSGVKEVLKQESLFVVSFSNFMDETSRLADLIIPTQMPLETWDEYTGKSGIVSTLQPTMGRLSNAPAIGDLMLKTLPKHAKPPANYKAHLVSYLRSAHGINNTQKWDKTIQMGGILNPSPRKKSKKQFKPSIVLRDTGSCFLDPLKGPLGRKPVLIAAPSLRHFDGRSSNRPWLCEARDVMTGTAWKTPVLINPVMVKRFGLKPKELIRIARGPFQIETGFFETKGVKPGILIMSMGQGHSEFGRYAKKTGFNPVHFLSSPGSDKIGPSYAVEGVTVQKTNRFIKHGYPSSDRTSRRTRSMFAALDSVTQGKPGKKDRSKTGKQLLNLPYTEANRVDKSGFHIHDPYRWVMVVDLDRCIGCGACMVACYAENNIGVVGPDQSGMDRDLAWIRLENYSDFEESGGSIFVPMLCQHCDQSPCETVCPVFASHHSKEGLNNQIYNRCIGARYCARNCPYHVRRFNWFDCEWPKPLHLQLNPEVMVRTKGVMEKCSFCVQRIKQAHAKAGRENRLIRDGEMITACMQTCPTDAIIFGNILDPNSQVRKLIKDPRSFQVLGKLKTKPGVIYLKKISKTI